ncbi:hypothetical protein QM467_06965 [Rhodoblastus sp. 17X3]|uniref:hypothetical protein n=1 Tax=Rhodoblastus sp. 17X3 TaxID=3047026 RepID=UPI0024B6514C|nr:hypothetical protein [Rhodoblastus sp. 17X3]MDI9847793.1 hypothetical protein [Rhodoblastus sp. 17X3]
MAIINPRINPRRSIASICCQLLRVGIDERPELRLATRQSPAASAGIRSGSLNGFVSSVNAAATGAAVPGRISKFGLKTTMRLLSWSKGVLSPAFFLVAAFLVASAAFRRRKVERALCAEFYRRRASPKSNYLMNGTARVVLAFWRFCGGAFRSCSRRRIPVRRFGLAPGCSDTIRLPQRNATYSGSVPATVVETDQDRRRARTS